MKARLTLILLSLSNPLIKNSILVISIFSFLLQISCSKDDSLETLATGTFENANSLALATGTTFYIDPTGNDAAGNGSVGNPWKTLFKACNTVKTPGDIIHINAGTYVETSQSVLSEGVSIEGEGSTSVIQSHITADWSPTISLTSGSEGTNGNQSISYIKLDGCNASAWGAIYIAARSNVKIHHCTFNDFLHTAVIFNGKTAMYDPSAPSIYPSGNEFYNNTVSNCSEYTSYGSGALFIGGQSSMIIHDNTITQNSRPGGTNGYLIKYYNDGYNKGIKIYNNTLIKAAPIDNSQDWNFAIELWYNQGGIEIYNNTIFGAVDLVVAQKGSYAYSADIHDNVIGYTTLQTYNTSANNAGIFIEETQTGPLYVRNNLFRNIGTPIQMYPDGGNVITDIYFYNNIFSGIGTSGGTAWSVLMACAISPGGSGLPVINNFNFINNTVYAGNGGAAWGIQLPDIGKASNITIRNNIIQGFAYYPVYSNLTGSATIDNLSVENNLFYGNISSNSYYHDGSLPTQSTVQNNITGNPKYVTLSNDYHLQSGSPAINAGLYISNVLTDYDNIPRSNPPEIGAYEYGTSTIIPVYQSALIENNSPSLLEMTYSSAFAGIVPVASSFSVLVNSVTRSISSVSVSGTKVILTLGTPVVYGDIVTVAYTKPETNPLQTSSGGQAVSISPQPVTNNVASTVVIPVFTGSTITNAEPAVVEISYNTALANIVPAAASFSVQVNSVARAVSSVSVSGTKVLLTLSTPVVYGDIVTVAYTKPSINPLQTLSGGQAATLGAQPVSNNCALPTNQPPAVIISSPVNKSIFKAPATITITAIATDIDGAVGKVEFYNGSKKLGEKTTAPYIFIWKYVPRGTYSITVAVTDNQNLRTTSKPVLVNVTRKNY